MDACYKEQQAFKLWKNEISTMVFNSARVCLQFAFDNPVAVRHLKGS